MEVDALATLRRTMACQPIPDTRGEPAAVDLLLPLTRRPLLSLWPGMLLLVLLYGVNSGYRAACWIPVFSGMTTMAGIRVIG